MRIEHSDATKGENEEEKRKSGVAVRFSERERKFSEKEVANINVIKNMDCSL